MSFVSIHKIFNMIFCCVSFFIFVSVSNGAEIPILARQYVAKTIHIPSGIYVTPYVVNSSNTEYILDGNIVADGTAISVAASKVVINLNGYTITYNQKEPGCGVLSADYNFSDVAIINGSIIQGAAMSPGVVYGSGSNPIRFHSGTPSSYNINKVQIAGIYAKYGSIDVGGINLGGSGHLVEENTIEDTYDYGVVTDRHVGIAAIRFWGGSNVARNNIIINARQRGIDAGNGDLIYKNTIGIRSICTNSYGVYVEGSDAKIYKNTITGRGEHPLGVGAHNSTVGVSKNVEIYENIIDTQVTRLGVEYSGGVYPSNPLSTISSGDTAVGIRSTSGSTNLLVHDNIISVRSDRDFMGTWSPDGRQVRMSGSARGIMAGLRYTNQSARFFNNTITVLDKDGTGYSAGIACDANIDNNTWYSFRPPAIDFNPNLIFESNTVTSNLLNIAVGDSYGPCSGYPLFIKNVLIKSGSFPSYASIGSGLGGYYEGTGRFISNSYKDGASENNLNMNFQNVSNNVPDIGGSYKNKSVKFGRIMSGTVKDASNLVLSNIRIRTYDKSGNLQTEAITDANGISPVIVYDYELNNNLGKSGSTTPIRVDFKPHTINLFNITTNQNLFSTVPDNTDGAWDAVNSFGIHTLNNANGSITLSPLISAPKGLILLNVNNQ